MFGKIQTVEAGVAGCTQQDVELVASEIWVVSASSPQLPLQIDDASRPEKIEVHITILFYENISNFIIISGGGIKYSGESRHKT